MRDMMKECVQAKVPATQKAVLMALAYGADKGGKSAPSVREIADRAGVTRRTVQRTLRALEAVGLLRYEGSLGSSSTYTVFPKVGVK